MPYGDGATKKSLMIQCSSYDPNVLVEQLEHIRQHHKNPAEDDYIYDLVIQESADWAGNLRTDVLDLLVPYLPGGNRQAFNNVFVGTDHAPWNPADWSDVPSDLQGWARNSAYVGGILTPSFRWHSITQSTQVAQDFVARYPQVQFHWYLTYEADLALWGGNAYSDRIAAAYEAFMLEMLSRYWDISPGKVTLWSPSFQRRFFDVPNWARTQAAQNLARVMARVRNLGKQAKGGGFRGIDWLHLQDACGQSWCWPKPIEPWDARRWWILVRDCGFSWASLGMNMELFKADCGTNGFVPLASAETASREDYYESVGVPVRGSFEMRYWYPSHVEVCSC